MAVVRRAHCHADVGRLLWADGAKRVDLGTFALTCQRSAVGLEGPTAVVGYWYGGDGLLGKGCPCGM